MKPRLRIVNDDGLAHSTRVYLVDQDEDGEEQLTDVTAQLLVTRVGIDLRVGEANRATLECLAVGTQIDAVLDEMVVRHVGVSRFGRLAWRFRKWRWRINVVTTFGAKERARV